ncbi:hypothetical protein [Leptospira interrogans]|uniref:Uncharacterized protein n=1 Tax=Leptospira interrogans str. UI 12621 TaxID=1049937 RepID=A0A0F6HDQ3_LEPIR|nr:hypothetical protein [Leptospira interrogans]EKO26458.1 hypothetical protein LEP1GSC104_3191 [Leptospira interrogans str. UI 12621]MBM2888894.1 hypothetical protein [Leptospira interrogans]
MVQVDKKGRKLKKSEEKRIQKLVTILETHPDLILWAELIVYQTIKESKIPKKKAKKTK